LTQEENNIQDLDAVIDHLLKLRNKAKSMKVVTASFGVACTADPTFLSIFTLLAEKWALQQTPLYNFLLVIHAPFATVNHLLVAWRLMWIPPLKKKCT
jgi:dethiobiotin synthetase